jgi:hypothetical protein
MGFAVIELVRPSRTNLKLVLEERYALMHSSISSAKLSGNGLKPSAHFRRYLRGGFLLALLLLISTAPSAIAQTLSGAETAATDSTASASSAGSEQFSDSKASTPVTDPATILRNAKLIYVRKKSVYFKAPELENELRKRPEFQRWGMAITRNELDADLIIEVGRKVFTTRFVYTVIDRRTDIIVASGKLSSLGGTLSTKIAKRFIEQVQKVRP